MTITLNESPANTAATADCMHTAVAPVIRQACDYLTGDRFDVVRCQACGLMITQPLPTGADIGKYYPDSYRGNRHSFTARFRTMRRQQQIERRFASGFRGRILDVGCGDGTFARHMQARGWDVSVTEMDRRTISRLSDLGIDARCTIDDPYPVFDRPFDAITCWHVMEHVEQPAATMRWVRSVAADNSWFQVTVPNALCLQARVFGRHWFQLDVPRHRAHFSPSTLSSLLRHNGFAVDEQTNFGIEYDWFGLMQSALNLLCRRPNLLFDWLTTAPVGNAERSSVADRMVTMLLAGPAAAVSLPVVTALAVAGDGATLTLHCRPA